MLLLKNIILLGIMPGFSEHFIHFLFPLLTPPLVVPRFLPPHSLAGDREKKMQAIFSKEDKKTYEAKKKTKIGRGLVV